MIKSVGSSEAGSNQLHTDSQELKGGSKSKTPISGRALRGWHHPYAGVQSVGVLGMRLA